MTPAQERDLRERCLADIRKAECENDDKSEHDEDLDDPKGYQDALEPWRALRFG